LFIYLDHCLTHSQQSLCRSKSSSALLITASQKLRQLCNIHRDPPRFILREHFAALLVADDEAGVQFLDRSGQREAAWLGAALYHE
jgi:hypothetical protein